MTAFANPSYIGYLGDQEFLNIVLEEFFANVKKSVDSWREGRIDQNLARLEVESETKRLSVALVGLDPLYKPVLDWSGAPLAVWLRENAEIDFQVEGDLSAPSDAQEAEPIVRAYVGALASMYIAALAAEAEGKMDAGRWRDWLEALKRKMCFQLRGIPG